MSDRCNSGTEQEETECRHCGELVDIESTDIFKSVSDQFWHKDCFAEYCYERRELVATTEGSFKIKPFVVKEIENGKEEVIDSFWRAECPVCYRTHESDEKTEDARLEFIDEVLDCCDTEWLSPADWIEDCEICGTSHRESRDCKPLSMREPFPDPDEHRYECSECGWTGEGDEFGNPDGYCPECDSAAVRALKIATDGGTVEKGTEQLRRDEGCPIYLHNVGGKEPDGKPTRLGKWTFATKMVRDVVLDHVDGRVLNACAGKTRLQKRGCEFFRNDIDEDRDADLHVDVREIDQHLESETFDAAILDPPFDPGRAAKLYEGWHGQEYANARDAVAELVCPGGTVVELGWNSWSLSDKDGWEPVEHHLFRQSSFKGDVHLTVDRRINQSQIVPDRGDWNSRSVDTGTEHSEGQR